MKLSSEIKVIVQSLVADYKNLNFIIKKIINERGKALLVGGAVRDLLLGKIPKDLDIEVYGVEIDVLQKILEEFGMVNLVGKSFGVLRLSNLDIDWSLPREDSEGRKPKVHVDSKMNFKKAFIRRDLTINAMGIDLGNYELIDPFNGLQDLQNKMLKVTDKHLFVQDPLRFFRVMQFIARFKMEPDKKLNNICKKMDIKNISVSRIEQEFEKLFLKSEKPSLGIRWLQKIDKLKEVMPELFGTIGVKQDKKWHPEGDVFEHLMQALDASAQLEYKNDSQKLVIMYATLCHDLGKVTTTEVEGERITSKGHAQAGVSFAKKLLKRITTKKRNIKPILLLVKYHMAPVQLVTGKAKNSAYKRLARKLYPYTNLSMLAKLAIADSCGRNGRNSIPLKKYDTFIDVFLDKIKSMCIQEQAETPILKGRDLLDIVGPGKKLGNLLQKAYEIQLEEGITDKDILKKKVLKKAKI